jgi:anthranilate phosphoribosyltransferase
MNIVVSMFQIPSDIILSFSLLFFSIPQHGNRASSSKCGSADLLEYSGIRFHSEPQNIEKIINHIGFCFLFAQDFHPVLKSLAPFRKELGIRTIFNILGPLLNPSEPKRIVTGVCEKRLGPIMIEAFKLIGMKKAIVVYGHNGLDEVRKINFKKLIL